MKINTFYLILLLSFIFPSCIIESYHYFDFLKPLNYSSSIAYHGTNIDVVVYEDNNNEFSLTLNCLKSVGDSIDYYQLQFFLNNYSKDNVTVNLSEIQMYNDEFYLEPDKTTDKILIVGSYNSKYADIRNIIVKDSLRTNIRFLFDKETDSLKTELNNNLADIVITNIRVFKNSNQLNIPSFYFKE